MKRALMMMFLLSGCGWSQYDAHVQANRDACELGFTYVEKVACYRNVYHEADQVGNHPASYVHKMALSQLYGIAELADQQNWSQAKWNAHSDAVVAAANQVEAQIRTSMMRGLQYDIQQAQRTFAGILSLDQRIDQGVIIQDRYYY